ncbi:hypothetical protein LTR84_002520 [Exophiala bonariae]|uniref:DUF6536 domain-containing protein n=1 Tax=Exophiala bonariae TaxID=1690606 RepID=A0AAV9N9K2_9EURO|nr:hypothetical protein LTR84_002520 [Exophiala bonariae]
MLKGDWRKTVAAATCGPAALLICNVVLMVIALTKYESHEGIGTLYTGDCDLVKHWDTGLHVLINVLSTTLLAASNFTMQCLRSPTRTEVDYAHARGRSLAIGVPSIRNLAYMKRRKALLWAALAFSSLPLHLLWNTAVFTTLGAHNFCYIVVDESFFEGAEYQEPNSDVSCWGRPMTPFASIFDAFQ